MPEPPDANPYPGPRPFETADRELFFGRDREKRELVSLILAHRVVLLYAPSGAGKTSLLNAGVVPALEDDEGFEALPPIRMRPTGDELPPAGTANAYAFTALSNLATDLGTDPDPSTLARSTLADFLAEREPRSDSRGLPLPRVLIFDQFEELFIVYPEFWAERRGFVRQIVEALEDNARIGPLRVVLALREEHLAELAPYARLMPDGFRIRRRLERLGKDAALDAVTRPLQGTKRAFRPGVAERLVEDLLRQRIERRRLPETQARTRGIWPRRASDASAAEIIEGEFVEPVQLQVVCRSLWSELPPEVTEITEQHLEAFGDVDQVLRRLYDDAVRSALKAARAGAVTGGEAPTESMRATAKAVSLREGQLRARIEDGFITSLGTRDTQYRGRSSTAGIPNTAVEALERERLLRAESRLGARFYELTHDSLIDPIRTSNEQFRERRRRRALGAAMAVAAVALAVTIPLLLLPSNGGAPAAARTVPAELNVAARGQELTGAAPGQQAIGLDTAGFVVALSSGKLDFGRTSVDRPARRALILSSGSSSLSIVRARSSLEDFQVFLGCDVPGKLPARRVCPINVVFTPLTRGRRTAVLRIVTRETGASLKVTLTGIAAA